MGLRRNGRWLKIRQLDDLREAGVALFVDAGDNEFTGVFFSAHIDAHEILIPDERVRNQEGVPGFFARGNIPRAAAEGRGSDLVNPWAAVAELTPIHRAVVHVAGQSGKRQRDHAT